MYVKEKRHKNAHNSLGVCLLWSFREIRANEREKNNNMFCAASRAYTMRSYLFGDVTIGHTKCASVKPFLQQVEFFIFILFHKIKKQNEKMHLQKDRKRGHLCVLKLVIFSP